MGVKVRKKNGKWYVFIHWQGKRKARSIGASREAAERVRTELERRLALGIFRLDQENAVPTFSEYAESWMASHVRPNLKSSTAESYQGILDFYLVPDLGTTSLDALSRSRVKEFLAKLSTPDRLARNTVRNVIATLRAVLSHAVEDGVIPVNPAVRFGRFNLSKGRGRRVDFLTREEADHFLEAARERRPRRYILFLTALRAGLRLGELLALQWDDIQFGTGKTDKSRHILVRHNIVRGQATSPKNRKPRRVDLSRELRQGLLELRDQRIMEAIERGEFDEERQPRVSKFVLPAPNGGSLHGSTVYHRDFLPCLEAAGLRHVTFHALRHTFASLLIQSGASLAYVKEQMGHSSIQVTVDTYGHLIPGGNIKWIDRLDSKTSPRQNATPAQPAVGEQIEKLSQVTEKNGRPGGIRTPDPRFRKPLLYPSELQAHTLFSIVCRYSRLLSHSLGHS